MNSRINGRIGAIDLVDINKASLIRLTQHQIGRRRICPLLQVRIPWWA
jgi:hypothetical protein